MNYEEITIFTKEMFNFFTNEIPEKIFNYIRLEFSPLYYEGFACINNINTITVFPMTILKQSDNNNQLKTISVFALVHELCHSIQNIDFVRYSRDRDYSQIVEAECNIKAIELILKYTAELECKYFNINTQYLMVVLDNNRQVLRYYTTTTYKDNSIDILGMCINLFSYILNKDDLKQVAIILDKLSKLDDGIHRIELSIKLKNENIAVMSFTKLDDILYNLYNIFKEFNISPNSIIEYIASINNISNNVYSIKIDINEIIFRSIIKTP